VERGSVIKLVESVCSLTDSFLYVVTLTVIYAYVPVWCLLGRVMMLRWMAWRGYTPLRVPPLLSGRGTDVGFCGINF
jgi:hypothetical protein